jgi:hypothetical protein
MDKRSGRLLTVGVNVGRSVGVLVGDRVGTAVGADVGATVLACNTSVSGAAVSDRLLVMCATVFVWR